MSRDASLSTMGSVWSFGIEAMPHMAIIKVELEPKLAEKDKENSVS